MMSLELEARALRYAKSRSIKLYLSKPLGNGTDGSVWPTNRNSAVKALLLEKNYLPERLCYQRLRERGVERIDGLAVPRLIDFDDELLVVEVEIVQPPFLLDFGKAYIDRPTPFTQSELAEYNLSLQQYFRKEDIPRVKKACRMLSLYGISYWDAKPGNIKLRTDEEERALPDDDWDKEPEIDYDEPGLNERDA